MRLKEVKQLPWDCSEGQQRGDWSGWGWAHRVGSSSHPVRCDFLVADDPEDPGLGGWQVTDRGDDPHPTVPSLLSGHL